MTHSAALAFYTLFALPPCSYEPESPVQKAGALGPPRPTSGFIDRARGDEEHADAAPDLPTLGPGEPGSG